MPDNVRPNRSVADYESEDALRKALLAVEPACNRESGAGEIVSSEQVVSMSRAGAEPGTSSPDSSEGNLDWVLSTYDVETTEVQSMKEELNRLQVLKSYHVLDSAPETAFERITSLAGRIFDVPIALVSLVDLGRQWFLSNRGLGDCRETPRKHAFCAHAILSKNSVFVVPDARHDFRFKDNPLVTSSPDIRFYAGAPLISPEGYKLGTCCIISDSPRPEGLNADQKASLCDLADMVVQALVDRRNKLQRRENPAELIAYAAHDLMTPLTGVQLSLSLLSDDDQIKEKLGAHQQELLSTATNCCDLMIRICKTMDSLRRGAGDASRNSLRPSRASMSQGRGGTPRQSSFAKTADETMGTNMTDLVKSLNMIMEPMPKQVPLVIRLDPTLPQTVVSDDLKLFRSALNLLSSAATRTRVGCIQLRIFGKENNTQLVFECEDTGDDIPIEEYQYLYQPCRTEDGNLRLCLSSVANLISSLDGQFGFHPRRDTSKPETSSQSSLQGSIFWFSVPLVESQAYGASARAGRRTFPWSEGEPDDRKTPAFKAPILPLQPGQAASHGLAAHGHTGQLTHNDGTSAAVATVKPAVRPLFATTAPASSIPNISFNIAGHPRVPASKSSARVAVSAAPLSSKPPPGSTSAAGAASSTQGSTGVGAAPAARQRCALVIDDSLVVRKSLAMALKKLQFEVSQAVDGLDGLKQMKEKPFDLVLCDFLMPVMDGFDCVKQIRSWEEKKRPGFRQLIIGISAHANENVAAQGIAAGMDDFKPKPISMKLLKEIAAGDAVKACTIELDAYKGDGAATASAVAPLAPSIPEAVTAPAAPATNTVSAHPLFAARKRDSSFDDDPLSGPRLLESIKKSTSRNSMKRARFGSSGSMSSCIPGSDDYVCLIATDRPTKTSSEVLTSLESHGWKVVVVHDGLDTLRLLQMRNWDAVLIDEDLPLLAGCQCIKKFRQWEAKNRVNRQKNTFLVVDIDIPSPSDGMAIVQPPSGFDFVLRKPVVWNDLKQLLQTSEDSAMAIVMNG